jgi:hypothetical protein
MPRVTPTWKSRCNLLEDAVPTSVRNPIPAGFDRLTIDCSLHLRWELQQMMSRVQPEHLSDQEIIALCDVLQPADLRINGELAGHRDRRGRQAASERPQP